MKKTQHLSLLPWIVAAVGTTACAQTSIVAQASRAHGDEFAPASARADQGVVYVYRPFIFKGSGVNLKLASSDRPGMSCEVRNGGYRAYVVPAGTLKLETLNAKETEFNVEVASGESKYVKLDLKMGAWKPIPVFTVVDETIVKSEISKTKSNKECEPI